MQEGTKLTGDEIKQNNEVKYQQHIAGEEHDKEDTNEVHAQRQHQIDEKTMTPRYLGNKKMKKIE
eukprot:10012477-Heterocapsa_arctica.AAC.1